MFRKYPCGCITIKIANIETEFTLVRCDGESTLARPLLEFSRDVRDVSEPLGESESIVLMASMGRYIEHGRKFEEIQRLITTPLNPPMPQAYKCPRCGQVIRDGKECGCGARRV